MFIQTEDTPNPQTLKFLPGKDVAGDRPPVDIKRGENVSDAPLAEMLFMIPDVMGVFFGNDFVSVTKKQAARPYRSKSKPALQRSKSMKA